MIDDNVLKQCRECDLYELLLIITPDEWEKQGKRYLKHKVHNSCVVTRNKGFAWNSKDIKGTNPIDFLIKFYGYTFNQAISIICDNQAIIQMNNKNDKSIINNSNEDASLALPNQAPKPWDKLYDYLCNKRKLDINIVNQLIAKEKIYLACVPNTNYYNICFCNKRSKHYELNGTGEKRFKQINNSNSYWYFGFNKTKAYVCESAIDAISLYQLTKEKACYISVGGSNTRKRLIYKIVNEFQNVILALDNDEAGDKTAKEFPQLKRIIPKNKDWNEDLIKL